MAIAILLEMFELKSVWMIVMYDDVQLAFVYFGNIFQFEGNFRISGMFHCIIIDYKRSHARILIGYHLTKNFILHL